MKDHIKNWVSATWAVFLPSVNRYDSDIAYITIVYEQQQQRSALDLNRDFHRTQDCGWKASKVLTIW